MGLCINTSQRITTACPNNTSNTDNKSPPPDPTTPSPRATNQHRDMGDQRTVHCYGVTRYFSDLLRRTAVRLYVRKIRFRGSSISKELAALIHSALDVLEKKDAGMNSDVVSSPAETPKLVVSTRTGARLACVALI